jgi:uncharacterized small protein (DUF1192 family)
MNRKKMSDNFRQKWGLIAVLAALFIGYLVWKLVLSDADISSSESPSSVTEQIEVTPDTPTQSNEMTDSTMLNEDTALNDQGLGESADLSDPTNIQALDPKAILNAPLPETDSLAKEEIDRLEDERQRLAEQEKLAAEQLAMNKQLTDMKAEQIALLEQQIAELEANNTNKPVAE